MIERLTPRDRAHFVFRAILVATLISSFVQVTLGGVVRVTGSGLGCPGWPLCHGRIIPPFDLATIIEYSHRLSASVLVLLIVITAVLAVIFYRNHVWVIRTSFLSLALVIVAAILGGITVLYDLKWWLVLLHLIIAESLIATVIVLLTVASRTQFVASSENELNKLGSSPRSVLIPFALLGTIILILSGSYMVGIGAGSACPTWPLCMGSLMPDGFSYAIHMGHRLLSAIVGLVILSAAVWSWSHSNTNPRLRAAGLILGVMFVAQVLVGAAIVWMDFSASLRALHLSFATAVWVTLMFLAALIYSPRCFYMVQKKSNHF